MGRFFLSPRAKRRKKRTTGRQRGTTKGEGEGPRAGAASAKAALSFGAQPCCPEGPARSEAEWSPLPVRVEKRSAAKRNREVAFALQSQATGTEKKQAGQVWVLKLIGISTKWAHSESLKRGAWDWRVLTVGWPRCPYSFWKTFTCHRSRAPHDV